MQAVRPARAQVGQRLEISGERSRRSFNTVAGPARADQGALGRSRTGRYGGHAAVRDARGADAFTLHLHRKRSANRGDILIESLRHLIAREPLTWARARHAHRHQEFSGFERIALIAEVETFERYPARARAAAQFQFGVERNQYRHGISDRRAVGEIAAQSAGVAHRR